MAAPAVSPVVVDIKSEKSSKSRGPALAPQHISPITTPTKIAHSLHLDDCCEYLVKFVEQAGLTKIYWRSDTQYDAKLHRGELRDKLMPHARAAAELPSRLNFINREFLTELAILSLYDLAILVDDSQSMAFDEQGAQIQAMKKVLAYIADIYARTTKDHGIRAIRFLNGTDNLDANNLQPAHINKAIDNHEFEGLTKLGTGLMLKLLKPLIFTDEKWDKHNKAPRKLKELHRPLLIMVVAGGMIEGERLTRLPQAISSVYESLKAAGHPVDNRAIRFQFLCLGRDKPSERYYDFLDNHHSKVRVHVDTMRFKDLMDVIAHHNTDKELSELQQRKILKLFLGPIIARFDKDVHQIVCDNADDDFDDEEEDEWVKYHAH